MFNEVFRWQCCALFLMLIICFNWVVRGFWSKYINYWNAIYTYISVWYEKGKNSILFTVISIIVSHTFFEMPRPKFNFSWKGFIWISCAITREKNVSVDKELYIKFHASSFDWSFNFCVMYKNYLFCFHYLILITFIQYYLNEFSDTSQAAKFA